MENDTDAGTELPSPERPKEYFSVRLTFAGTAQEFEDPREAGAAFFRADPAERPSVAHINSNTARSMAYTELHGTHDSGDPRYFKSLPNSHAPDAAFRAGFLEAMETSISERLGTIKWSAEGQKAVEQIDTRLKDDLEAFARREPEKAADLWLDLAPERAVPPGPELRTAVEARETWADQDSKAYYAALADSPLEVDDKQSASKMRSDAEYADNPASAISIWMEQSSARIDRLPSDARDGLQAEMYGIAAEAASAFGLDLQRAQIEAPPRSTLYRTAISTTALAIGAEEIELRPAAREGLKAGLLAAAAEAGIDGTRLERRLETGAANARQEDSWVRSDIAEAAARHRLDLGKDQARSRAADLVDRFYERAAELVLAVRTAEISRDPDPLVETLGTMAKVRASQGEVRFRNEDQARDFAEGMTARYGTSVLKDLAAGRTEALSKDVPDPSARQAMAQAVVAAAKEHPSLGLGVHEAEAAEQKLSAAANRHEHLPEHARDRSRDREL